jgi:hypothetical protein
LASRTAAAAEFSSALVQQVVEKLTLDDMLAIAAYTASRQP